MADADVWFVTGCSTGIGRSIAEGLIAAGRRVVVTARRPEQVADLAGSPGQVLALPLDITDEAGVAAAIGTAIARMGRIDVLVNNAAVGLVGSIEESTAQEVETMFATNVLGTLAVIRHAAAHMRARRSGYIMTVGSIGSFRGQPGLGIYAATKHALAGAHDALAGELKPLGVRATLLALGSYRTGFRHRGMKQGDVVIGDYDETSGAVRRRMQAPYPAEMGDPATVAPILLKLAEATDPPARLAVGADALEAIGVKLAAVREEFDAWADLSIS